jgi:hypothetical protein
MTTFSEKEPDIMSNISSSNNGSDDDDIYNDTMYNILGQFLVNEQGKNVTTMLTELTNEMTNIRLVLSDISQNLKELADSKVAPVSSFPESVSLPVASLDLASLPAGDC